MKKALEVTHELGGEGYTFWGGREGYQTLFNTDMKRELDHLARFLHMAVDYEKEIGFTGPVLHRAQAQGADQAPVRLRRRRLPATSCASTTCIDHFKLNLETNHATLAGHTMHARTGSRRRCRASSARSTPTPATCCSAGTPTSSRPTST